MNTTAYAQPQLDLGDLPHQEPALPLQPPTECGGCDALLRVLDANDEPAPETLQPPGAAPRAHVTPPGARRQRWVDACESCWDYGYRPPTMPSRAEVVISNCLEHASNGVGLSDASVREGYGQPAFLESVLRRWGRRDVSAALIANENPAR